MLRFDSMGLLTPNTNIATTLIELKEYFVDNIPSETRLQNYEKYIYYSTELKKLLGLESMVQWVDGSFVTSIRNPKDIDLVTFIDFESRTKLESELKRFEARGANTIYGVDAYILTVFPEDHKKSFYFQSDKAYWNERFTKTRRDNFGKKNPKGFVEIIF